MSVFPDEPIVLLVEAVEEGSAPNISQILKEKRWDIDKDKIMYYSEYIKKING